MHRNALDAARAAAAAGRQGKFWEMHDRLFANQTQLDRGSLQEYARDLGLDVDRFREDLESDEVNAAVEADMDLGRRLGVDGTPTIFVNGRLFGDPLESLSEWIEEELSASR